MGKGDGLDIREWRAATAMLCVLGVEGRVIVPRDVRDAPQGTHDFDISKAESVTAVEVSTLADHRLVASYDGWHKMAPGGVLEVNSLAHTWILIVNATGSSKSTAASVQAWLSDLESRGERFADTGSWARHAFTPEGQRPANFDTLRSMAAAGVSLASVLDTVPPGTVFVTIADGGYTYDPSDRGLVPEFVSRQLTGDHRSDVEKLDRATADERILFLWLDARSFFWVTRSLDGGLPEGDIAGSGSLDEVWIGRHFHDDSVTAYRWSRTAGWGQHDLTAVRLQAAGMAALE